jgi:hypothetical protein
MTTLPGSSSLLRHVGYSTLLELELVMMSIYYYVKCGLERERRGGLVG